MANDETKAKKRLHFGVVFSTLDNTCQYDIWNGIVEFAKKHDIHLTAYFGTYQATDHDYASHFETIFENIKASKSLDGVIMFSGFIAQNIGNDEFERYAARLPKGLPLISVSFVMPGVPSVLVDNIAGIYSAVEHMIQAHGKKNIAFVKGPDGHPEAEDRLLGYKRALEANGLTYDERYVFPGYFTQESGQNAVISLLSDPQLNADAIAVADDETAVGVLVELKNKGFIVPSDFAVTGFDDDRVAATFIPSISTARQDFYEIGVVSAGKLLDIVHERPVDAVTYVPPVLMTRQSCGCIENHSFALGEKIEDHPIDTATLEEFVSLRFTSLFESFVPKEQINEWITSVLALLTEKPFSKDRFLQLINHILVGYHRYSPDYLIWNEAFNILTMGVELHHDEVDCTHTILSTLIFSTTLVHDIRFKEVTVREFVANDARLMLRRVAGNLVLSFDIETLAKELFNSLPEIDINTTLIGLYRNPIRSDALKADRTIDTLIGFDGKQRFNMKHNTWNPILLSDYSTIDKFDFERERRDLFFIPLFFKEEEVGAALMPFHHEISIDAYETLRVNISTAIKGAELLSKIQTLSITDELTGLLNRRGFFQFVYSRLQHLYRSIEMIPIVMFMDMDGLKMINDTYGHSEGDVAISAFASVLKEALREEDIIGRMGGDEFVVFSSVKNKTNGEQLVQRIRTKLDEYNNRQLHPYRVAGSIGSVILETSTRECFEAAMLSADSVLYEEKMEKKKKGLSRQ